MSSTKKIKCSGSCYMCANAKDSASPCENQGKVDNYSVAEPDVLVYRLDSMNIPKDLRIDMIRYLRDSYDIAYRPSLVYVSTLALLRPSVDLPPVIHKVFYKGRTAYLINNDLEILSNIKELNIELDYEEIVNPSIIHVLMQSWKSHLVNLSNKWEIELIVNDRVNNTMELVCEMVDDVLDAYIETIASNIEENSTNKSK